MRSVFTILFVSTIYVGSVFLVTQGKTFRLDSDYDSNLPIISYVVDTIRNEHRFPFWNPYVSTGISVLGDPLSGITYLPYFLPMLFFDVPGGWWVVIWLHAFMAGAFMRMFLKGLLGNILRNPNEVRLDSRLRGNDKKESGNDKNGLALWGGLLYMAGGAFAARVAAGHIEKVLSFPWYPLFLMALLKKEQTIRTAALTGAVMGVVFLTGDVYALFFMMTFYGVLGVIRGIGVIREIGVVMAGFVVVVAVKLVPFLLEVAPVMSRYSSFDAARGSIPAWFSWLPFVMPAGVAFYDRPILQRLVGFWYNWYEYYAFIGLPIVFLLWIPKIVKRREVQLLLILLAAGTAYVARGQVYSPFFGLSPIFSSFRVPQRMFTALTSVVVALIVLSAAQWKKPKQWVLWGMLLVTFLVSGYQMTHAFEPPRACCTQLFLIREKVRMINYYYGWLPKTVWENQN